MDAAFVSVGVRSEKPSQFRLATFFFSSNCFFPVPCFPARHIVTTDLRVWVGVVFWPYSGSSTFRLGFLLLVLRSEVKEASASNRKGPDSPGMCVGNGPFTVILLAHINDDDMATHQCPTYLLRT